MPPVQRWLWRLLWWAHMRPCGMFYLGCQGSSLPYRLYEDSNQNMVHGDWLCGHSTPGALPKYPIMDQFLPTWIFFNPRSYIIGITWCLLSEAYMWKWGTTDIRSIKNINLICLTPISSISCSFVTPTLHSLGAHPWLSISQMESLLQEESLKKPLSTIYKALQPTVHHGLDKLRTLWMAELPELDEDYWEDIWDSPFNYLVSSRHCLIQFKILHKYY